MRTPARASLVRALLAGLAIAACLSLAAFVLEAAILRQVPRSDVIAADALRWLTRYRLVKSAEVIGRRRGLTGTCVESWFRGVRRGRSARGSMLFLSDGERVLATSGRVFTLGATHPLPARPALLLAGCPRVLGARIALRLGAWLGVPVTSARADGRRAYVLRLGRIRLYVDRRTMRPIAVRIVARRLAGWGDIEVRRLTPAELRRVRVLLLRVSRSIRLA